MTYRHAGFIFGPTEISVTVPNVLTLKALHEMSEWKPGPLTDRLEPGDRHSVLWHCLEL
jgi:hypothetical protein